MRCSGGIGRRLIQGLSFATALALVAASAVAASRTRTHIRSRAAAYGRYRSYADTAAPAASDLPMLPGDFRFWDGATVASGDVETPSECGVTGPCYMWPLKIGPGGRELRVALDTPQRTNQFELDVVSPSGQTTSVVNFNAFDGELYVEKPAAGKWTVRVMPQQVNYSFFRMRAKLEGPPPPASKQKVALLPQLEADPPTEFTFVAPANPANGLYPLTRPIRRWMCSACTRSPAPPTRWPRHTSRVARPRAVCASPRVR